MSKKLAGYVFRRIRGRLIPIRIGKEAQTLAAGAKGISQAVIRKLKLVEKAGAKFSMKGKMLLPFKSPNPTESMRKFMEKTGALRFSQHGKSITADLEALPTTVQRKKFEELASNAKDVYIDAKGTGKGFEPFDDFWGDKMFRKLGLAKGGGDLEQKAIKQLGLTDDPREAGYILRDGKMLDLSGKKDGGPSGVRYLDHREVSGLVREHRPKPTTKNITQLMREEQKRRKFQASRLHQVTSVKHDIVKIEKVLAKGPDDVATKVLAALKEQLARARGKK